MSKNKKSRPARGRLARWAGYATIVGAVLSLLNSRVRGFVGSKLVPVTKYIPGQVARRKTSNPGK